MSPAATLEYFSGSDRRAAGTGSATAPTNAGTYTVRASFAGNGNYDPASAVKTIVIEKAAATVAITWATPQTYNSASHPATAQVNGVGGDTNLSPAATLEYFSGSDGRCGRDWVGDGADERGHLHGARVVRWQRQLRPGVCTKTIVIEKADGDGEHHVGDAADLQQRDASGDRDRSMVSVARRTCRRRRRLSTSRAPTAGAAGTGTATAPTNAGTYTVRASFAGNGNYDPDSAVKTITIEKATATVAITWATPQTYNERDASGDRSGQWCRWRDELVAGGDA